jgi:hypothetical protein
LPEPDDATAPAGEADLTATGAPRGGPSPFHLPRVESAVFRPRRGRRRAFLLALVLALAVTLLVVLVVRLNS